VTRRRDVWASTKNGQASTKSGHGINEKWLLHRPEVVAVSTKSGRGATKVDWTLTSRG
jgi:hypothetical protein